MLRNFFFLRIPEKNSIRFLQTSLVFNIYYCRKSVIALSDTLWNNHILMKLFVYLIHTVNLNLPCSKSRYSLTVCVGICNIFILYKLNSSIVILYTS